MGDAPGRIVAGVGSAVGRAGTRGARAQAIQAAMVQAIQDCLAEGLIDPEVIRARQLAAKDAVLKDGSLP